MAQQRRDEWLSCTAATGVPVSWFSAGWHVAPQHATRFCLCRCRLPTRPATSCRPALPCPCRLAPPQIKILKADRDVYAAEIDEKLIFKIGPGDFAPAGAAYAAGRVTTPTSPGSNNNHYNNHSGGSSRSSRRGHGEPTWVRASVLSVPCGAGVHPATLACTTHTHAWPCTHMPACMHAWPRMAV